MFFILFLLILYILFLVLFLICISSISYYFIFKKVGRRWEDGIIPIYNEICSFTLAGLPNWYFFLYLVPIFGLIVFFYKNFKLSQKFTDDIIIQILIAAFPFVGLPYLGFSKLQYRK